MNILAFDTATNACSAALLCNGVIHEQFEVAPRMHTQLLLPMIESVLELGGISRKQLNAIAFIAGPGSFTGIRIATSMAQGLSLGLNIPVIPLSSLLTLACGANRETGCREVLPCIDARREQVYWAHYSFAENSSLATQVVEDKLSSSKEMLACQTDETIVFGTGVPDDIAAAKGINDRYPRARDALCTAADRFTDDRVNAPGDAQAIYFRRGL